MTDDYAPRQGEMMTGGTHASRIIISSRDQYLAGIGHPGIIEGFFDPARSWGWLRCASPVAAVDVRRELGF